MSRRRAVGCGVLLLALSALAAPPAPADAACGSLVLRDGAAELALSFRHDSGAQGRFELPETMGAGVAWIDADTDGWPDLYVVQSGAFPPDGGARSANRLFRNVRGRRFDDVSAASGAADRGYGQGVTSADVDGDGRPDLFVCNYGADALYLNRGEGRFQQVPGPWEEPGWSSSAAFADADGDGDLDLYVTRYLEYDADESIFCGDPVTGRRRYCDPTLFRGAGDRFYVNQGQGRFEDRTAEAGFAGADGKGLGVVFADLDGDAHPDVYVANDLTANLLFRNRGDGTFEDVSLLSGAGLNRQGQAEAGMGLALGDIDGDADPDLLVTNFDVETNTFYRNDGGLVFEDVSGESGFGTPSFNLLGFGIVLADLDLDGDLDAYAANGHIYPQPTREGTEYRQPDLLLLGDGRGRFRRAHCGSAFEAREVGRALAAADHDNDGDLDLVLSNNGGPLQLLINGLPPTPHLGVQLRGRAPNTDAIGARVTLEAGGRRQTRWILAGDSYQATSDRRLLFGVGDAGSATLEVRWPSGASQSFAGLDPGGYVLIHEGEAAVQRVAASTDAGLFRWRLVPSGLLLLALLAAALVVVLRWRRG